MYVVVTRDAFVFQESFLQRRSTSERDSNPSLLGILLSTASKFLLRSYRRRGSSLFHRINLNKFEPYIKCMRFLFSTSFELKRPRRLFVPFEKTHRDAFASSLVTCYILVSTFSIDFSHLMLSSFPRTLSFQRVKRIFSSVFSKR